MNGFGAGGRGEIPVPSGGLGQFRDRRNAGLEIASRLLFQHDSATFAGPHMKGNHA